MKRSTIIFTSTIAVCMLAAPVAFADGSKGHGRHMFKTADQNNDGKLSRDERNTHVIARITKLDTDGDGEISLEEMTNRIQRQRDERRAKRRLARLDYDGDGKVTKEEILKHEAKRFSLLDRNDDGFIERAEMREGRKFRKGRKHHGRNKHRHNRSQDL